MSIQTDDLKNRVREALKRSAQDQNVVFLDSADIPCAANKNKYKWIVGLHGQVHEASWSQLKSVQFKDGDWKFFLVPYNAIYQKYELDQAPESWVPFNRSKIMSPNSVIAVTWEDEPMYWPSKKKALDDLAVLEAQRPSAGQSSYSSAFNTREEDYLRMVEHIKKDIVAGAYYEANYTIEGRIEGVFNAPFSTFLNLSTISPAPFSAYFQDGSHFLISSSPERFVAKYGKSLFSQPIKGTAPRSSEGDNQGLDYLSNSDKERAEHVMIVDLVRNDLTQTCTLGSIEVEELMQIYGYSHIYQMVSTISGELRTDAEFIDVLNACFPMGSMTGAPKLEVIKTMNLYEDQSRGMYSGTLGYIDPDQDMDSSVIIRSVIGHQAKKRMAINVGGAITYDSDAQKEYEECLLKASKLLEVLKAD